MAEILGENYGLSTVAAPHGLLHMVHHNGNHRTAAIRAAGFPVALVETERYESPWMLPLMSLKARAHMRLLFRAGLLSNPHVDDEIHQIYAEGDGWVILLLLAASPKEAVKNVVAYEHLYGRCEAWPEWLRDGELLDKLIARERLSRQSYGLELFTEVAGKWPPPSKIKSLIQELREVIRDW